MASNAEVFAQHNAATVTHRRHTEEKPHFISQAPASDKHGCQCKQCKAHRESQKPSAKE